MNQHEKQEWWARTLTALEARDPRVYVAILTSLILRHGKLEQTASGETQVVERVTIEDLLHVVKDYHIATRVPEYGVVELRAIPKGEVSGNPPNISPFPPGSGPNPFRAA